MEKYDIGLVGLGVMGRNLLLNMADHGYSVAGFDTDLGKVQALRAEGDEQKVSGAEDIESFIASLREPRTVMMLVPAGAPVDAVINNLIPHLRPGDTIIDGGNSHYRDTERRAEELAALGLNYLGTGVSGGEEGARKGPAIMPGGQRESYEIVAPIFEAIAAKVDGEPCVSYIGPRGSGHYVKMVHNGIEYGDMQLIAEAYDLLHRAVGLSAAELHEVFARWNRGVLSSFLIEITADIFTQIDPETNRPMIEFILDKAGQKGTGKWTSQDAMDLGVPTPTINAALEARIISAYKAERVEASKQLRGPDKTYQGDTSAFIEAVGDALYASKICSYAQGMSMLRAASEEYGYNLDYAAIARLWRGGCIIRARFLNDIALAFTETPDLPNLLLAPFFQDAVNKRQDAWRHVMQTAIELGIPAPAMSASLAYYDSYRTERLPANLLQAQRDYFGAHTYQRTDREGKFHTEWNRSQAT